MSVAPVGLLGLDLVVERIWAVSSAMTVTVVSSAMARTRLRAWMVPMPRWCMRSWEAHLAEGVEAVVAKPVLPKARGADGFGFGQAV